MQIKKKYLAGSLVIAAGLSVLIAGAVIGNPALIGGAAAFLILCMGCTVTAQHRKHPVLV